MGSRKDRRKAEKAAIERSREAEHSHVVPVAWAILITTGTISLPLSIWHAFDQGAFWLVAILYGVAPVLVAALQSHNVAAGAGGKFKRLISFLVLGVAMLMNLKAQAEAVERAAGVLDLPMVGWRLQLKWLFPLMLDLSTFTALHTLMTHGTRRKPGEAPATPSPGEGVDLTKTVPAPRPGEAINALTQNGAVKVTAQASPQAPVNPPETLTGGPGAATPGEGTGGTRPASKTPAATRPSPARKPAKKSAKKTAAASAAGPDIRDLSGAELVRRIKTDFPGEDPAEVSANSIRLRNLPMGSTTGKEIWQKLQAALSAPEGASGTATEGSPVGSGEDLRPAAGEAGE
jgi:hypothetical protein